MKAPELWQLINHRPEYTAGFIKITTTRLGTSIQSSTTLGQDPICQVAHPKLRSYTLRQVNLGDIQCVSKKRLWR